MLVGDILTVNAADLMKLALLYGAVGAAHALCRRPLLAAAQDGPSPPGRMSPALWDFVFYATFGLVVTSSVALAGVLLVFSFLIIPAVIGSLFSPRIGVALAVGWSAGVTASLVGFAASIAFDAPTGAAMVVAFAGVLLLAAVLRVLLFGAPATRRLNRRRALLVGAASVAAVVLAQGVWLIVQPTADQPLLAFVEDRLGLGPERFLTETEWQVFREAADTERHHRAEVERLSGLERDARWRGRALREDELRRVASFQQTFNEMGRGERFVQDHLRAVARARERWIVGVPMIAVSSLGLLLLLCAESLQLRPQHLKRDPIASSPS
jgi:zinc/manganese transport system permease protein